MRHAAKVEAISANFKSLFEINPELIAVSPGRVNIIGEHVDHQGYSVLPVALQSTIELAYGIVKNADYFLKIRNINSEKYGTVKFNTIQDVFIDKPVWYNYVIGGFYGIIEYTYFKNLKQIGKYFKTDKDTTPLLEHASEMLPKSGLTILVDGDIPIAAGVSSSSALTVAASLLFVHLFGAKIDRLTLASICSLAEQYSSTLGGGMDQAAILMCDEGIAQHIEFSPLRCTPTPLPKDAALVVCNTGIQAEKAVQASIYYNKRVFELKISCYILLKHALPDLEILPADIYALNLSHVQKKLKKTETEMIELAKEVLPPYRITKKKIDHLIGINISSYKRKNYFFKQIYSRVLHVFTETIRVDQFIKTAQNTSMPVEKQLQALGHILNKSHYSLNLQFDCSSPELEEVIDIMRSSGAYGARLTGAGWGGCAVGLVHRDNVQNCIDQLRKKYFEEGEMIDTKLKAHALKYIGNFVFAVIPSSKARLYLADHTEIEFE